MKSKTVFDISIPVYVIELLVIEPEVITHMEAQSVKSLSDLLNELSAISIRLHHRQGASQSHVEQRLDLNRIPINTLQEKKKKTIFIT